MVLLAIFPHPDDESFGPAPALARLLREGHDVHLLTLTHGEATKERERYGYSKEEMGAQRRREMDCVARTLGLTSMEVLALPDGELANLDPRAVETPIRDAVCRTQPDVILTYPVHGISGHPDHLVTHAAVKRVFVEEREAKKAPLRRLAFFGLPPADDPNRPPHLRPTPLERFAGVMAVSEADLEVSARTLDCYTTYAEVVRRHDPLRQVREGLWFELFDEPVAPRRSHLLEGLEVG
ncbi:MAG TPA: PIG-L family deacetylase [Rhodothermales bacterium]|nr:PIG-L family deacetylase [Rhodothermales bacterium]